MTRKVAIALGGGGAKFFAHLGMFSVLNEQEVPYNYFSCSSMGSIAGSLIANKVDISDIKKEFYKKNSLSWFKPAFKKYGFFSQDGISDVMNNLLPQPLIEKSKIKFSITASNLLDGKLHLFTKGSIVDAVKASCAFPGIFAPVELDGKMLVDGGVLNNLPADICRKAVGQNGVVITSSLDQSLKVERSDVRNVLDVYQRVIYVPMYEKRTQVVNNNSDFLLNHFSGKKLSVNTEADIIKLFDKKSLDSFYELGRETTLKQIKNIKRKVNSFSLF